MPLKLRPTGSAPGSTRIASAASTRPAAVPRVCAGWSFYQHGPMMRSGRVATLEEAKAQFQKSWEAWKAWAKLEEVP